MLNEKDAKVIEKYDLCTQSILLIIPTPSPYWTEFVTNTTAMNEAMILITALNMIIGITSQQLKNSFQMAA